MSLLRQKSQTQGNDGCPSEHFEFSPVERLFDLLAGQEQQFLLLQIVRVPRASWLRVQAQEEMRHAGAAVGDDEDETCRGERGSSTATAVTPIATSATMKAARRRITRRA